jgi:hypothetical protein
VNSKEFSSKRPLLGAPLLPRWGGRLEFRYARAEEAAHLKKLYEAAWGNGITISEDQIRSCISNFPEGQIVGTDKRFKTRIRQAIEFVEGFGFQAAARRVTSYLHSRKLSGKIKDLYNLVKRKKPISMINIMLYKFDPNQGLPAGYANVTGDRTFSTTIPFNELLSDPDVVWGRALPMAFCVSIAVPPKYAGGGRAKETLNYTKVFSTANHLIPAPYSAPRGFARARKKNPDLSMFHYLHMTKPTGLSVEEYIAKYVALSPTTASAFNGDFSLIRKLYDKYQKLQADSPTMAIEETAFWKFMEEDGLQFFKKFGRNATIEDFCILSGRVLLDPVIGMHVSNGARFIRDEDAKMAGIFENSRPEDPTSLGYNIVLSYTYHELLGHAFMASDSNGKDTRTTLHHTKRLS